MRNPITVAREQLHDCDGGKEIAVFGERLSPAGKAYGLGIARRMSAFDDVSEDFVPTPYVTITVSLFLKPEDWKLAPGADLFERTLQNRVIEARIPLLSKEGL
ncbi:MAG: hypothetical protein JWR80_9654 [Bradyrhizobium sp.]|nr:hypothetical protein [Bradyrhizobium sp.]